MKKSIFLLPLLLLVLHVALSACEKDPEIITRTIIETDTLVINHYDTVVVTLTDTFTLTEFLHDTATTFLLVRHAETTGIGSNPDLGPDGLLRATELARVLKNVPLDAAYSTNLLRTTKTAQPTATDQSLTLETYDGFTLNPVVDAVLANHRGGAALVVGHSNTTPALLNLLTGTTNYSNIPETQYDNLYVVTVFEKGRAQVTHLKYGKATP
jgi:broad specificity phosphatase PhoE